MTSDVNRSELISTTHSALLRRVWIRKVTQNAMTYTLNLKQVQNGATE